MPHIHEKIDFTVEAFIVHKGRVFLRMHDKYDLWLPPGGHIEPDEDPVEAVVREVKEETGLDVVLHGQSPEFSDPAIGQKVLLAPRFMSRHRINETHEHIAMYYFATSDTDKVVPEGDDRSDEWKWFAAEELAGPECGVREDIRFYAREALRELGGNSA